MQEIISPHNCILLVIHHSSKQRSNRAVDSTRGHSSLTDSPSQCLDLNYLNRHEDLQDKRIILSTDGRGKGSNLIITVDCGINSNEPLKELNKTKIDCIIIDHHTPDDDLPPAFSIVNPKRKENGIEYHYLSAVGVTFIMIVGLTRELRQRGFFKKSNTIPKPFE